MLVFNINFNKENPPLKDIIRFAETKAVTENIVKEYMVWLLIKDENVLSRVCEENTEPGKSLKSAALSDLEQIMELSKLNILENYIPSIKRNLTFSDFQKSIEAITEQKDLTELLNKLILHYHKFGSGELSECFAFKWSGKLYGIDKSDDISLCQLFCLDSQKKALTENTLSFLHGLPSNNALLYGSSGCGKSSMVKALLNEYRKDGLRMVQIPKDNLDQLPLLIDSIKNRSFRYIVFMDDLSFEADDSGYKSLKSTLEGGIEKQPENVLFYATSNRLHIINETWTERETNIHFNDTKNEKLSLSERFGIRISFESPEQDKYLKIVEGILSQKNIPLTEDIRAEALKWALYYNGRSGRTAAQFANMIISKNANLL